MGKDIGENISKNLDGKHGQKFLDHAKKIWYDINDVYSCQTSLKWFHRQTAEVTGELTGNKIANQITKIAKNSQQNISETVTNDHHKEIPEERYVSSKEKQQIIDELKLN